MSKIMLSASCVVALAIGAPNPAAAQYGGAAGNLLGTMFNGIAQQQQQQAIQQQQAARAYQQQQYEMQREAAAAQAQANAQARQEEFARQQDALRQQNAIRARHDSDIREAARKAAEIKQQAEREAAAVRAKADAEAVKRVADQVEVAQTVAENSPENHCKEQEFAKAVLTNFNKFKVLNRLDKQVIDIEHLTTDKYDVKTTAMVCHGTFLFNDGAEVAGDFEIRKNVAGDLIYLWSPDALDGGRAHIMALNAGPMQDIQQVTGTGSQTAAPKMVVIPASDSPSP